MTDADAQFHLSNLARSLENQTKGKVCRVSGNPPIIVMHDGTWVATCDGHNPQPCLWRKQTSAAIVRERMGGMLARTHGAITSVSALNAAQQAEIKSFLNPKMSDLELKQLLYICATYGADPFSGEIFSLPFKKQDGSYESTVCFGVDFYRRRASVNHAYDHHQSGVVVLDNQKVVQYREGSMLHPGDTLWGGWCDVWRKGASGPQRWTVELSRWNKPNRPIWKEEAPMMIAKVAESQGLHRYMPESFQMRDDGGRPITVLLPEEATEQHTIIDVTAAKVLPESPTVAAFETEQDRADLFGPSPAPAELPPIASLKDLWAFAAKLGYGSIRECHAVLGIKDSSEIADTDALRTAAAKLRDAKGGT